MKVENGNHSPIGTDVWSLPLGHSSGHVDDIAASNANDAYLFPFWVPAEFQSNNVRVHFTAIAASNYDIGIYDNAGNLLKSLGSTVVPGAAGTDTKAFSFTFRPGLYWKAFAISSITPTMSCQGDTFTFTLFQTMRFASSFPLPSTLNLSSPTGREAVNRNFRVIFENANGPAF